MKCPSCNKDTLRAWEGTESVGVVSVSARALRCTSCGEKVFDVKQVEAMQRAAADAIAARGARTGAEFRLVRKAAGLRANELAALLDVTPETVSRWEKDEREIPRLAAFVVGELLDRPRVVRGKLEELAAPRKPAKRAKRLAAEVPHERAGRSGRAR